MYKFSPECIKLDYFKYRIKAYPKALISGLHAISSHKQEIPPEKNTTTQLQLASSSGVRFAVFKIHVRIIIFRKIKTTLNRKHYNKMLT